MNKIIEKLTVKQTSNSNDLLTINLHVTSNSTYMTSTDRSNSVRPHRLIIICLLIIQLVHILKFSLKC
jgi:hypothetical protein